MKTKEQKKNQIEKAKMRVKESRVVIVGDFTGLSVNTMNGFRKTLKDTGMKFEVLKKRLFGIVCKEDGIPLDPKSFKGQTGVIFSSEGILETSQIVYRFAKANKDKFKILGGADIEEKKSFEALEITQIGQLPSREVLLGKLVGVIASPIKSFLFVLNEKARLQG